MSAALSFDFTQGPNSADIESLSSELTDTITKLDLKKQQSLAAEIGKYMRQQTNRRLKLQKDINGKPFKARKYRKSLPRRGRSIGRLLPSEMLLGFNAQQQLKTDTSNPLNIRTGYAGRTGKLARWHNEGTAGDDAKKRPKRQWLGISAQDQRQIQKIIASYLSKQ